MYYCYLFNIFEYNIFELSYNFIKMNKFYNEDNNLDFKDVLIVPKNSYVDSRSEVVLEATYRFRYYNKPLLCVPIIVSNMTSTGTISMAKEMSKYKCLTVLHKYIDIEEIKKLEENEKNEEKEFNPHKNKVYKSMKAKSKALDAKKKGVIDEKIPCFNCMHEFTVDQLDYNEDACLYCGACFDCESVAEECLCYGSYKSQVIGY